MLQKLALEHGSDPRKSYLIGLLAEHTEEDEMTDAFMIWLEKLLMD